MSKITTPFIASETCASTRPGHNFTVELQRAVRKCTEWEELQYAVYGRWAAVQFCSQGVPQQWRSHGTKELVRLGPLVEGWAKWNLELHTLLVEEPNAAGLAGLTVRHFFNLATNLDLPACEG